MSEPSRSLYRLERAVAADRPLPEGLHLRTIADGDDGDLAQLMEHAYAGTIDEQLGGNSDGAVEVAAWRAGAALPEISVAVVADADDAVVAASMCSGTWDGEMWIAYVMTELAMHGVGYDVAAKLLVAAGDNPQRLRSEAAFAHLCGVAPLEASSGKTRRHRLNRGGDRQANNAVYRVVITRMASHPPRRRATSPGAAPKASPPVSSCASSSATSPEKPSSTSDPAPPPPERQRDGGLTPSNRPTPRRRLFHERNVARHPRQRAGRDLPGACPQSRVADLCPVHPRPPLDNTGASLGA